MNTPQLSNLPRIAVLSLLSVAIPAVVCRATSPSVTIRSDLHRSAEVFRSTGKGCVAFIGGSITEMNGYRPMVMAALQKRFPETQFDFVNAGISSTCSHTGAFRLSHDVLSKRPDLLFIEFAVNDDQDASHSYGDALRGMEGVVRSTRSQLPKTDLVITHFVNPSMLERVQSGGVPTSIRAHEAVAAHYGVSTCNVAVELAERIKRGQTSWQEYGGTHPKPAGNRVAADLVEQVLDAAADNSAEDRRDDLPDPIDPASFVGGRFLPESAVRLGEGWMRVEPDWKSIDGSLRDRFAGLALTCADTPGASLELAFSGTAFGLYVLAGPDAGRVEYSIDGGAWQSVDLYHRFSERLHYPRTVVLGAGLGDGDHTVMMRVSADRNDNSGGNAVRVLEFVAS